jgi:hypothetical protein
MSEPAAQRFIDEPILVEFDLAPAREKSPPCPNRFIWQGETFQIGEMLAEWSDFTRKGRAARNMRPSHAAAAAGHGSLGVGRFFFRVRTDSGRIFDLYYDRAPKDAAHRKGEWFLYRELGDDRLPENITRSRA